eukprot:SAG11_NODE_1059_length_6002_cov_2.976453_4_plen_207_part_00
MPLCRCTTHSALSPALSVELLQEAKGHGLLSGHAYSLLAAKKCADGTKLICLRNPWGQVEWTGDYSDESDKWTDALKQETGFKTELDENGKQVEDGRFWMCWADFIRFYDKVGVCNPWLLSKYTTDTKAHCAVACAEWVKRKSAGGRPMLPVVPTKSPTYHHNPSFILTVPSDLPEGVPAEMTLTLAIFQPDVRRPLCHQFAARLV